MRTIGSVSRFNIYSLEKRRTATATTSTRRFHLCCREVSNFRPVSFPASPVPLKLSNCLPFSLSPPLPRRRFSSFPADEMSPGQIVEYRYTGVGTPRRVHKILRKTFIRPHRLHSPRHPRRDKATIYARSYPCATAKMFALRSEVSY